VLSLINYNFPFCFCASSGTTRVFSFRPPFSRRTPSVDPFIGPPFVGWTPRVCWHSFLPLWQPSYSAFTVVVVVRDPGDTSYRCQRSSPQLITYCTATVTETARLRIDLLITRSYATRSPTSQLLRHNSITTLVNSFLFKFVT
jgi:hypothetical protein